MDSLNLQGVPPFVVVVCAALAAWGGWPYVAKYWPQIQALLSSLLKVPVSTATAGNELRTLPRVVAEPAAVSIEETSAAVPEGVAHLVALERELESAGVAPADRAKLVDPLWPKILRPAQPRSP